ncbi:epoxide hydrolase [Nocardioides anomalus]|uniref:Epoxide hydrolase n=1 Tax=Nocardioides anomalus TaxID=2712223 RepID=A0A6G6WLW5_9ACTN|nr:epoxide hydrolase [Nocardioides anomalus]
MQPFRIEVAGDVLDDLRDRLRRTRWPDAVVADWTLGTPPDALRTLVEHWAERFDWRATEARLDELDHVRVEVHGVGLHAVRAGRRGAPPLLLAHGWPDSFLRFERLLPLLADDFELVVPSIPGYGFSDRPTTLGSGPDRVADLFAGLMTALGHDRFGYHGGDIGTGIGKRLALRHPDRLLGVHLTDVPWWHLLGARPDELAGLSEAERDFVREGERWYREEGAYAAQQATRPQTLAYALTDSPAGLAGWFLEKFQAWSDGDVFDVFNLDWLCANLTVYWVTGTAASAARYYFDSSHAAPAEGRVTVPTGFAVFPADLTPEPRALAERSFDLVRWTELPRGGHFAAYEVPELLAGEVRSFFAPLVTGQP